jgi:hypothetical protein
MTDARNVTTLRQSLGVLGIYLGLLVPGARLFRYSCETCFRHLWDAAEGRAAEGDCGCMGPRPSWAARAGQSPPEGAETFVILYDGMPSAYARPDALPNIHLDAAFSPMALYTLLAREAARSARPAPPRWVVVDAHGRADAGMFALARIFAPHVTLLDPQALERRGDTLRQLIDSRDASQPPDPRRIEAAERHLQALLTAPGRRHAVSNIVGPVLLGFRPRQQKVEWVVSHLRRMLAGPGAVTAAREISDVPPGPWVDASALSACGSTEFVLVDDQYRNGWGQVLCNALGASFEDDGRRGPHCIGQTPDGGVSVSVSGTADFLLDKLERAGAGDQRFGLRLGTQGCAHEILLLDLRLFEGAPLRKEASFLARVAALARARFRRRKGLAYPGFGEEELREVESWLACVEARAKPDALLRSEAGYLRALAMLPRVIALTDFSLPVIIFSSTGQREVTELLKDYGSVITTFEKPRLFGYQHDDMEGRTRASFRAAVARARHLLDARNLCVSLLRGAEEAAPPPRRSWESATHLELYVDESGSSVRPGDAGAKQADLGRFVIAGLLVAYRKTGANREPAHALHRLMASEGLRWWPESAEGPYLLKYNAPASSDLPGARWRAREEVAADFLRCARDENVVAVCVEYDEPGESDGDLRREDRNDTRYRNVLSALLELTLFDLLPALSVNPQATLSLFVATRVRGGEEFESLSTLERMEECWGYEVANNRVFTVQEDAVLPILVGVLDRRSRTRDPVRFEHARGVRLSYPCLGSFAPKWARTRHQHYVVDLVAGACRRHGVAVFSKWPWRRFFKDGTYDLRDQRLDALLRAARLLSRGDLKSALLELKNFDWSGPPRAQSGTALLLGRLARAVRCEMNGAEFVSLAAALGELPSAASQRGTRVGRGTITWLGGDPPLGCIHDPARNDYYFSMSSWSGAANPQAGELVEFSYRRQADGRNEATRVKSLP